MSLFSRVGYAQAEVLYYGDLYVDEPVDHTTGAGLTLCYWTYGNSPNCLPLTGIGEVVLMANGKPGKSSASYLALLSQADRKTVETFFRLEVTNLATGMLASPPSAGFIIQISFSADGVGSQSLYVFGNLENGKGKPRADGYGSNRLAESGFLQYVDSLGRSLAGIDDQALVNLSLEVADIYLHGAKRNP